MTSFDIRLVRAISKTAQTGHFRKAETAVNGDCGWQTVGNDDRGGDVTEQRIDDQHDPVRGRNLDELARAKGLTPIESLEDLERFALDVWDSDEDLEAFLADVRASRHAEVA